MTTNPLTAEQIVAAATPITSQHPPCIYFLIRAGVIVYVGQSKQFPARLSVHITEGKKDFDAYSVQAIPSQHLDLVEAYYILAFQPEYNETFNPHAMGLVRVGSANSKLLASTPKVKRWIAEGKLRARTWRLLQYVKISDLARVAEEQ